MKKILVVPSILIILMITAAACTPKTNEVEQLPVVESEQITMDVEPEQGMPEEPQQAQVSFPAWYSTLDWLCTEKWI